MTAMTANNDLPTYEVIALKYATRHGMRPDHFVGGDPHDVPMPMDYYVWVIRNADRLILVDTGFDLDMAIKRNRTLLRRPRVPLAPLALMPSGLRAPLLTILPTAPFRRRFPSPPACRRPRHGARAAQSGMRCRSGASPSAAASRRRARCMPRLSSRAERHPSPRARCLRAS